MTRDARNESFWLVDMDGYICLFTNMRLDRDTIPKDLFCYDVRDADCDGTFAEVQPYVWVNHWGTIISKEPVPLNEYGGYWPERDAAYLPADNVSLAEYQANSIGQLLAPYLDQSPEEEQDNMSLPAEIFRLRHKPFLTRTGQEQEQLHTYWHDHKRDLLSSASAFLGMQEDQYIAWEQGELSLDDGSYHQLPPSAFHLTSDALAVARQILRAGGIDQNISSSAVRDPRFSALHTVEPLLAQLLKRLPADQECMLSSFFDAATPNLAVYTPDSTLIAILDGQNILYKEDFSDIMQSSGIKPTEKHWTMVWDQFARGFLSASAAGISLPDQAKEAVSKVYLSLNRDSVWKAHWENAKYARTELQVRNLLSNHQLFYNGEPSASGFSVQPDHSDARREIIGYLENRLRTEFHENPSFLSQLDSASARAADTSKSTVGREKTNPEPER